jgi:uncharacterized membrane protein YgcG
MRCPYCRAELRETSPECPSCRLSLARAGVLLGPVPRLEGRVSDYAGLLGKRGRTLVIGAIERLERRFPQLSIHVMLREFSLEHPLEVQVFWLFNTAGFFAEDTKGSRNFGVLLALDPPHARSALMVGYGLEPFVPDEMLDEWLGLGEPDWQRADYAAGIAKALRNMESGLREIAESLPTALGIPAETASQPSKDY